MKGGMGDSQKRIISILLAVAAALSQAHLCFDLRYDLPSQGEHTHLVQAERPAKGTPLSSPAALEHDCCSVCECDRPSESGLAVSPAPPDPEFIAPEILETLVCQRLAVHFTPPAIVSHWPNAPPHQGGGRSPPSSDGLSSFPPDA
jgi:hypothetical protein